jgi:hypothetical protein
MTRREVLEHIAAVDKRHVERLTEDIDSLTELLVNSGAPQETIDILTCVRKSERQIWQTSLDRVVAILEG